MLRRFSPDAPAPGPGLRPPSAIAGQDRPWRSVMGAAMAALACAGLGVAIGLALTAGAAHRDVGIGATRIGAWSIAPASGTPEIDPYERARFATTGEIPMARGQGTALVAWRDDAGRKLDRSCSYRLDGPMPQARFWTLGAVDAAGLPLANAADRTAFTSDDVLRDGDGHLTIAIAAEARPGNWLPLAGIGGFGLVLRLYDTSVTALSRRDLRVLPVPAIVPEGCP